MLKKIFFFLLLAAVAAIVGGYYVFVEPNINNTKSISIKIPTGSNYEDVIQILKERDVLKSELSFDVVSQFKHYPENVKSGYYVFTAGMNNRQIINMLRAGWQTPVTLVIYNIRTKEEFASLIGRTLELDSVQIISKLNDTSFCNTFHLDTATILTRFIVDNYECYWSISQHKLFDKLNNAYEKFWNQERITKAEALHLSVTEVTTLASIVEKEVIRDKELPTVAGVYLNRLRIGMPLQADPTLVFALHDFNARRVTGYHKNFDSPYNTYKYPGLPPGPVCMPHKKAIDAVLNYEQHAYLYFCASPELNGYSLFSKTYAAQMKVAAQYRRKLDKLNVH
ncbi:MAG: endolytic transglycosylase MltG [Bacteroidetes bacterium]|nr:endolytic transglycosylase MltG [Bacteroidota bacterium]